MTQSCRLSGAGAVNILVAFILISSMPTSSSKPRDRTRHPHLRGTNTSANVNKWPLLFAETQQQGIIRPYISHLHRNSEYIHTSFELVGLHTFNKLLPRRGQYEFIKFAKFFGNHNHLTPFAQFEFRCAREVGCMDQVGQVRWMLTPRAHNDLSVNSMNAKIARKKYLLRPLF